jgi:ATP-dependent Clp protease protease subunit
MAKQKSPFENAAYYIDAAVDLEKRRIILDCEINKESVGVIIRAIQVMNDIGNNRIKLIINSEGGDIIDGLALIDAIQTSEAPIDTLVMGEVCSMAFIIFLAGDRRYATERASFLHHQGVLNTQGRTEDVKKNIQEIDRLDNICDELLADKTNKNKRWWKDKIKEGDFLFDVETALKVGVITDIIKAIDRE